VPSAGRNSRRAEERAGKASGRGQADGLRGRLVEDGGLDGGQRARGRREQEQAAASSGELSICAVARHSEDGFDGRLRITLFHDLKTIASSLMT